MIATLINQTHFVKKLLYSTGFDVESKNFSWSSHISVEYKKRVFMWDDAYAFDQLIMISKDVTKVYGLRLCQAKI